MQLWRPEFELDGKNSRSRYHCLPVLRGRLYSSCVQSCVLHRSETWPVRIENEVTFQRAEMRMVRWMCDIKVKR